MHRQLAELEVDMVVHVGRTLPENVKDMDYLIRRNAVDFGIPLLNNDKCARLFVDSLRYVNGHGYDAYRSSAVQSWKEWMKNM